MSRYKIVQSTKHEFNDIDLNLDVDFKVGEKIEIFNTIFNIIQCNDILVVLTNKDWCITLKNISSNNSNSTLTENTRLSINNTVEIFLETKEIEVKCNTSYEELFLFLEKEWYTIKNISYIDFPLVYNSGIKLLTLKNDWKFKNIETIKNLHNGSFSYKNKNGRYT